MVAVMAEVGVDVSHQSPKLLTDEVVRTADVIVTSEPPPVYDRDDPLEAGGVTRRSPHAFVQQAASAGRFGSTSSSSAPWSQSRAHRQPVRPDDVLRHRP